MKKLFTFLLIAVSFAAYSTSVTFIVDMDGEELVKDTVYIVGDLTANESGDWQFQPMASLGNGKHTWSTTLDASDDTLAYYYITVNSWDSAGNQDWTYYTRYREYLDTNQCGDWLRWGTERWIQVGDEDMVINDVWAQCPTIVDIHTLAAEKQSLLAYPNPSNGIVNIDLSRFSKAVSVVVYDITGKSQYIEQVMVSGNKLFTLPELKEGIYFITVSEGAQKLGQKIIVQ